MKDLKEIKMAELEAAQGALMWPDSLGGTAKPRKYTPGSGTTLPYHS